MMTTGLSVTADAASGAWVAPALTSGAALWLVDVDVLIGRAATVPHVTPGVKREGKELRRKAGGYTLAKQFRRLTHPHAQSVPSGIACRSALELDTA
jgi:hypothetical protein